MVALLFRPRAPTLLLVLVLVPILLFSLSAVYAHHHFWRDPTSAHFDATRAYDRKYTAHRLREAREFVQRYNVTAPAAAAAAAAGDSSVSHVEDGVPGPLDFRRHAPAGAKPYMCIGMNTIVRPSGDVYARDALGSVLAGLSRRERNQIYLMPMIGHINASRHPVYGEPWLEAVADRVLTYRTSETLPAEKLARIEHLELERQRTGKPDREKHLTDYTHLLRVCAGTGAEYVTMLEDDVLMADGWLHRAREAIEVLNQREGKEGWFYLRLFFTEWNFGWQSEEDGWYAVYIVLFAVIAYSLYRIGMNALPRYQVGAMMLQQKGSSVVMAGAGVLTFVLGLLYVFSSGRLSMFKQPDGLLYMPRYGCCAQGIVYPRAKIEPLTAWYEKNRIGFIDTLAERLADQKPDGFDIGTRWGVNPVLLQHVGEQSSKGDGWEAQKLWNFRFEDYDPKMLREQHDMADSVDTVGVDGQSWEEEVIP